MKSKKRRKKSAGKKPPAKKPPEKKAKPKKTVRTRPFISWFQNRKRRFAPRLTVDRFAVPVHLGVSRKERNSVQEIFFSVEMEFFKEKIPEAEKTDSIESACCYEKACRILRDCVKGREFHLIEHLAGEALSALMQEFPSVRLSLTIHKNPPVEGLKGGVSYTCGSRF